MFNVLMAVLAINVLVQVSSVELGIFSEYFWLANVCYYGMALGGTLLLAHLSYQYYEKPFLTLKDRYAQPKPTAHG
jgi:peptidoglycan/LPS O-acetylase OafA/YrhL